MRFAVFVPPSGARGRARPALYYLAGLTCTEETFVDQGRRAARRRGARARARHAATPARASARYPGDDASWDFGQGAGFYLDATAGAVAAAYRMDTYVTRELPRARRGELPGRDRTRAASSATRWAATAR